MQPAPTCTSALSPTDKVLPLSKSTMLLFSSNRLLCSPMRNTEPGRQRRRLTGANSPLTLSRKGCSGVRFCVNVILWPRVRLASSRSITRPVHIASLVMS